ncbi:MAG: J domain-containing protein [Synergistaceae bacterium]|nr:J domain-containing protein [Synergistaceae bacterium]
MIADEAYFRVLGLQPGASWDDIKRAFRRLARLYHPDVAGQSGERKFVEITEAYMSLKECVSSGFACPAGARTAGRRSEPRTEATRNESIFSKLWKKLFSRSRKSSKSTERERDFISPAKVRFIGSVLSRAESELYGVLSKKDEFVTRNRIDAVIRRLKSRYPAVVLLALKQISSFNGSDEIIEVLIDHFKKSIPISGTLERVLDLFSNSPRREELANIMLGYLPRFSETDAMILLKRFKRWKMQPEFLCPFLSHKSPAVVACALTGWPINCRMGNGSDLTGLLKYEDETILIPLLRVLKYEKLPLWTGSRLGKLMKEHPSPAVRVWASAIVRDQNLS